MNKVSVIVATCRREAELTRALDSLAKQTYSDMEIIVVDDNGCTQWNEKVADRISAFRKAHPDVELTLVVNHCNLGSAGSRNVGIRRARGSYITFLDDDDLYLPQKVERQVTFMEKEQLDYSITDLELYNEEDKRIDCRVRSGIQDDSREALRQYHLTHHLTGTDTLMFRTGYIREIGGFAPIDIGDEFYLMQKAIDGNGKFGYLPGCDVKAYIHTGEKSLSCGEGKIVGECLLYDFKKAYFRNIDRKSRQYIRMRHYAVLAFAEVRRKHYCSFFVNGLKSFVCLPPQCVKLIVSRMLVNAMDAGDCMRIW